jgi:hypothetical protein
VRQFVPTIAFRLSNKGAPGIDGQNFADIEESTLGTRLNFNYEIP